MSIFLIFVECVFAFVFVQRIFSLKSSLPAVSLYLLNVGYMKYSLVCANHIITGCVNGDGPLQWDGKGQILTPYRIGRQKICHGEYVGDPYNCGANPSMNYFATAACEVRAPIILAVTVAVFRFFKMTAVRHLEKNRKSAISPERFDRWARNLAL